MIHRFLTYFNKHEDFFLFFLFFCPTVYFIFCNLVHTDVAWHLTVAYRLVEGQMMYRDIIEVNLPFIYYFRTLPVFLTQLLGFDNLTPASHLVDLFFMALSSILIFYVVNRIDSTHNISKRAVKIAALISILFVPLLFANASLFGQKSHLFYLLALPYFLSHFADDRKFSWPVQCVLALFAGFAFSIKPIYVLIFVFSELFFALAYKDITRLFRRQVLLIYMVGLSCLFIFCLFFLERYMLNVMPIAQATYYSKMSFSTMFNRTVFAGNFFYFMFPFMYAPLLCLLGRLNVFHMYHLCLWAVFSLFIVVQQKFFDNHMYLCFTASVMLLSIYVPSMCQLLRKGLLYRHRIVHFGSMLLFGLGLMTFIWVTVPKFSPHKTPPWLANFQPELANAENIFVFGHNSFFRPFFIKHHKIDYFPYIRLWAYEQAQRLRNDDEKRAQISDHIMTRVIQLFSNRNIDLIIISKPEEKAYRYIANMSKNPAFSNLIQQYRHVKSFGPYNIYIKTQ